jgi:hypothetical protein
MIYFEFEGMKVNMTIDKKIVNNISLTHKRGMKFVVLRSRGLINAEYYLMQGCIKKQNNQNSTAGNNSFFKMVEGLKITSLSTAAHITTLPFKDTSEVLAYVTNLRECEITDNKSLNAAKQVYKALFN